MLDTASRTLPPQTRLSSSPNRPALSQTSMLELEFAELTDVGRVRDHNEDFMGHALPAGEGKAALTGGSSQSPMAWAAKSWAKLPLRLLSKP